MINKEIVGKTIRYYGYNIQSIVCMEECSELIQAISKIKRYGINDSTISNLVEEIADVEICLEMLKQIYDIKDCEVDEIVKFKQNRIVERMRNGD